MDFNYGEENTNQNKVERGKRKECARFETANLIMGLSSLPSTVLRTLRYEYSARSAIRGGLDAGFG